VSSPTYDLIRFMGSSDKNDDRQTDTAHMEVIINEMIITAGLARITVPWQIIESWYTFP